MENAKLVELVTAEVMRQLEIVSSAPNEKSILPSKQALVIFTGGTIGLEESLLELQKMLLLILF